ncbi:ATP-binding protein [Kineococcus auxinigenes]|uniref:ATP-binding protein n=1 Tax=unclassified Kineococcus TaxID=2621656 RepID=UPI003D7CCFDE
MPSSLSSSATGSWGATASRRPAAAAVRRSFGFAVVFCAAVFLGRLTVMDGTSLSLVWPAAGVAVVWFAAQRGAGTRWLDWPALALITFSVNVWTGAPAALAVCFVGANVAQVAVFGVLYSRWCPRLWGAGGREPLAGTGQLARVLAAAVLATAAGGVLGPVAVGVLTGHWSPLTAVVWMTRNTVSVVLIAAVGFRIGCLLSARSEQRAAAGSAGAAVGEGFRVRLPFMWPRGWRAVELIAVLACSATGYVLVFGVLEDLPIAFPLIALTVWVALRFDTTIVVVHDFVVGVVAVLLTLSGHGAFAYIPDDATRALVVQAFVGVIAAVGLALALGRDEREVLLARVRHEAADARVQRAVAEEHRRLAELAMAEAEERHELVNAVLETVDVGIVVAAPDGHLAVLNRTALDWHGLKADAAVDDGVDPAEYAGVYDLHAADGTTPLGPSEVPLARVLREGSVRDVEMVIAPAGRPPRTVLCSGRTLRSGDGTSLGAVVVMADVTAARAREAALASAHEELAQRSAELERSNAELAQFAGVASHDLNSPLTVIAGYIEMLGEVYGEQLGEQGRDWVGTALKGTTRMKDLIESLLAYSQAGAVQCQRDRVELRAIHDQAVLDLRTAIRTAAARVSAGPLPVLYGDPVLLRQLLQNLIGNAIKYRSPQRACRVAVSASQDGEGWSVAVADNGIGIPPEQRRSVFAMFAQVDRTAGTGHGIGLATCQRIVERHGGRIWVEETPGGGTTVRFTLPQRQPEALIPCVTYPTAAAASLN